MRCSILAGLIALAAAPTAGASLHGTIARHSFHSRALARKARYSVYLPPGYAASSTRYPVIYFLHGLPGSSTSYRAIGWFAAALERTRNRAIVIGAQGARHGQTDDEWLDRGRGRNWETATARDLVAVVDRRYRTLATRAGRAIVGVSAGGYGAALIGFHHPGTFSAIQSWSGYFRPTNPSGTAVLDLGSKRANERASLHALVPKLRKRLGRYYTRTWFGFFDGMRDRRFRPDNVRLHRELVAHSVPNFSYALYRGGHSIWRAHARAWISRALSVMAPPR